jgi:uncharacterized repeat protein (TIGR04138 family)
MSHLFAKAVHQACQRDSRYRPEAYDLVRLALSHASEIFRKDKEDQHVTGQELLEGFRQYMIQEFGPMSLTTLQQWGLHEGLDVGNIVYNLIDVGYFGKNDGDSLDDFCGGYDFATAFTDPFMPAKSRRSVSGLHAPDPP